MEFFERFRSALARYSQGVHRVGAPVDDVELRVAEAALGHALPLSLASFLRAWNGVELFHEEVVIAPARQIARDPLDAERLAIGQLAGAPLVLDSRGRVLLIDEDTERAQVVGSQLGRFIDAAMARGALLHDREGEFREGVFGPGEGVLVPRVRRRLADAGIKADPDAPAWHEELAYLFLDEEQPEPALRALEKVVMLDERAADAWSMLAQLRRAAGELDAASEAFRSAARVEPSVEEQAFALAQALRCVPDPAIATAVLRLAPRFVDDARRAAQHLIEEGDIDGARDRVELAQAVTPDDAELAQLAALLRARGRLKQI